MQSDALPFDLVAATLPAGSRQATATDTDAAELKQVTLFQDPAI